MSLTGPHASGLGRLRCPQESCLATATVHPPAIYTHEVGLSWKFYREIASPLCAKAYSEIVGVRVDTTCCTPTSRPSYRCGHLHGVLRKPDITGATAWSGCPVSLALGFLRDFTGFCVRRL